MLRWDVLRRYGVYDRECVWALAAGAHLPVRGHSGCKNHCADDKGRG